MMEEGEIMADLPASHPIPSHISAERHKTVDILGAVHSPSIEWPEDSASSETSLPEEVDPRSGYPGSRSPSPSSSLRLLVQHGAILRRHQKLALLDGFSEIEVGRDIAPAGSETPKIRLKEMEVSKLHATIYWDYDRAQWSIVDMGSKHGTFIQSATTPSLSGLAAQGSDEKGVRLSAPRVASMPRTLRHQDRLTIGGTTFTVHIHEDRTPCSACSPQADEEIPLFLHHQTESDHGLKKKRKLDVPPSPTESLASTLPRDPKKALAMLKRSLLSAKDSAHTSSGPSTQSYVDRSARRRALHPDHLLVPTGLVERSAAPSPSRSLSAPGTPSYSTTSPGPLLSTNIGHKLLVKQGWRPGSALGELSSDNVGLVVPLDPPSTVGRAGIGVPARANVVQDSDWKGAGKRRRWEEFRASDSLQ